jgi:hypothetical protein
MPQPLDAPTFPALFTVAPAAAAISTMLASVVIGGHAMATILLHVVPKLILLVMVYVSPACQH